MLEGLFFFLKATDISLVIWNDPTTNYDIFDDYKKYFNDYIDKSECKKNEEE